MSTGDFNDNFQANLLERINREGKRLILLGDFNINLLCYKENKDVKSFPIYYNLVLLHQQLTFLQE